MKDDDTRSSQTYRIARMLLDGASASDIAERLGVSTDAIDDAWQHCVPILSNVLAEKEQRDYREMTLSEFQSQPLECLRVLLQLEEHAAHKLVVSSQQDQAVEETPPDDEDAKLSLVRVTRGNSIICATK